MIALLPQVLLGFALQLAPHADELRFAPHEGLVLQKRFELETETKLDKIEVITQGKREATELQMQASTRLDFRFQDILGAVEAGEPLRIERRFEQLTQSTNSKLSSPTLGEQDVSAQGECALLGRTVRFQRSAPGAAWSVQELDAPKHSAARLDALVADLDFQDLLPVEPPAQGDRWQLDPEFLRPALAPSGDLGIQMLANAETDLTPPAAAQIPALGPLEGTIEAHWVAPQEGQPAHLARILLQLDLRSSMDQTEAMAALLKMNPGPGGIEMRSQVHSYVVEWALRGQATVLWDLQAGRLDSLQLEGAHRQVVDSNMQVLVAGIQQTVSNHMELSGQTRARIHFTP